jgi:Caspase domain
MRQRTAYLISVIACALALLQSAPAQAAEKRVALVIGNSTYAHAPSLRNPASDARAIADLLTKAGFDQVTLKLDLAYDGMRLALRDFGPPRAVPRWRWSTLPAMAWSLAARTTWCRSMRRSNPIPAWPSRRRR